MPTYRQLHEEQLRQNRPAMYRELDQSGQLRAYLDEMAKSAHSLRERLIRQMQTRNPYNPVEWSNSRSAWEGWIDRTVNEFVLQDRVLVADEETERAMREGGYTD
jgi:hypothetical protein